MRIVFMGTPDFAVPILKNLLVAGHNVAAVFTKPDKPVGRKQTLTPPPVKVLAAESGIPVYQPATLRTPEAEQILNGIGPDVVVVAAYGKILPKSLLELPCFGCVNIHASLLPKYRGAAPIQYAILDGERVTGVTAQQMAEGVDTGDILLVEETEIRPDESSGELTQRLSLMGASLIVRTLEAIKDGTVCPVKQDDSKSSYASMLSKKMSPVDWRRPAEDIHNQVRGLSPWPSASAVLEGKKLKLHRSAVADGVDVNNKEIGEIFTGTDGSFLVACGFGTVLRLLQVQPEGGKKMSGKDFLRGHPAQGKKLMTEETEGN